MRDLESRQHSRILAAAFIFFVFVAGMSDADFVPTAAKAGVVGNFAIAVLVLLVSADFTNLKNIFGFMVIYSIWFLIMMVYSMGVWIANFQTYGYIWRGVSKVLFQFVILLNIFAAVYMFGERGIHYTFYGLLAANIVIALLYIPRFGISGVVSSFISFVTSAGDAKGYMKMLEIHDITFTYGFFLIYFIFFDRGTSVKMRLINIAAALIFFALGYKRIGVLGLAISVAIALLLNRFTPRVQNILMRTASVAFIIIAFIYLVTVRYNVFTMIMNQLGVDMMTRDVFYDNISQYYHIGPDFLGYGFEYVFHMMEVLAAAGDKTFNLRIGIHNDIMRVYIEMGFWGFWIWGLYTFVFQYGWIRSKFSHDTVKLFFLCETYIFITYFTDNTLFYFFDGMVLRLIPLCYAVGHSNRERILGSKLILSRNSDNRFKIISRYNRRDTKLYEKKVKK